VHRVHHHLRARTQVTCQAIVIGSSLHCLIRHLPTIAIAAAAQRTDVDKIKSAASGIAPRGDAVRAFLADSCRLTLFIQ
jgi:hypothetical protein